MKFKVSLHFRRIWPIVRRAAHARRSAGGQLNFSVENYIEVKRVPAEQPKATIISFHNRKQKNRDFQCEISSMKNL